MKSSVVAVLLIALVAAASAEVYFREEFDGAFLHLKCASSLPNNLAHPKVLFMSPMCGLGGLKGPELVDDC